MKILENLPFPNDQALLTNIRTAADRLFQKLSILDLATSNISNYNKRYLREKLVNLRMELDRSSYILAWTFENSAISLNDRVFLEYGGGIGLLSLFAKELGIGTVIYNDIYDISCQDAKILADTLKLKADNYVHGDIEEVLEFFKTTNINCDMVSSYDVIEHIYDIKSFLRKLSLLSSGKLKVCLASGANKYNSLIRRRIIKKQIEAEYKDREKVWGCKERDTLKSYFKIRNEIIRNHLSEINLKLNEDCILKLVKYTRGLKKEDIERRVDDFIKTNIFPPKPIHTTNTCDPYTGNWKENLMEPYFLAEVLNKYGFKVKVFNGYYGNSTSLLKRYLGRVLNLFIYVFKRQGIRFSPFYMIYGIRK